MVQIEALSVKKVSQVKVDSEGKNTVWVIVTGSVGNPESYPLHISKSEFRACPRLKSGQN